MSGDGELLMFSENDPLSDNTKVGNISAYMITETEI
jgi:hypothetical protein